MRTDFSRCTFVFEVKDHKAFEPIWEQLHSLVDIDGNNGVGYRTTAMSVDDEMHRGSLYYEAMERYDDHYDMREAMEAIFQHPNISDWSWEKYEAEAEK